MSQERSPPFERGVLLRSELLFDVVDRSEDLTVDEADPRPVPAADTRATVLSLDECLNNYDLVSDETEVPVRGDGKA